MNAQPGSRRIYHITHVKNLSSILADGGLWSDAQMVARGGPTASIGISEIKQRRLRLPVKCHPGDFVGEYVPFNFCPRSVMLYILHRGNKEGLSYQDGQTPILHLEIDLDAAIAWCGAQGCRWALSLANAGAVYAEFRAGREQLNDVDWQSVDATDFRDPAVKEGKQAEFLIREFVPWTLVQRIGVCSAAIQHDVLRRLAGAAHRPSVGVCRTWYF